MVRQARDAPDVVIAVRRLCNIHAVITTASLALRQQNAEYDSDIAMTLIRAVADPMWSALEVLARSAGIELEDEEPREVRL